MKKTPSNARRPKTRPAHPRQDSEAALKELNETLERRVAEHKREEEKALRLNRTLLALGRSDQAMMHATEEPAYLKEVCEIIVEECGHAMVWIGYAEADDAKTVRPVASAGFEEGYLAGLRISWADTERGRGPTGTAIRTGRPRLCRNMLTDPQFAPWRDEALKRGYASSAVFPLATQGKVLGAVNIYSRDPDPFSEDEVALLAELADDLAYGIGVLRLRAAAARAEEALRNSEAQYRSLVDLSPDAIFVNRNNRIVFLNSAALELFGASTPEPMLGKSPFDVFHPDCHAAIRRRIETLNGGQPVPRVEEKIVRLDGEVRDVEVAAAPFVDQGGAAIQVVLRDITDHKRMRETLRQERDFVSAVLSTAGALVVVLDRQGRITQFNRACEETTGYSASEVLGRVLWEFLIPPEDMKGVRTIWESLKAGAFPNTHENFWLARDGSRRLIAWTNSVLVGETGEVRHIIGTGIDITDHRAAEDKVRWIARFPAENPNPILRISREGRLLYANAAGAIMTDNWNIRVGDPVPSKPLAEIADAFRAGKPKDIEMRFGQRTFLISMAPILDGGYVNLYGRDITDLRESQERENHALAAYVAARTAAVTVKAMNVGVVLIRHDDRIVSVNPTFESMCGCGSADLAGKPADALCAMVKAGERELLMTLLTDARAGRDTPSVPLTLVNPRGEEILTIVDVSHIPEPSKEQSTILLTVKDITPLRQAEARLRKSQATLAEAQRIAHLGNWDWNIATNALEWSDEIYRIFGLSPRTFGATYDAFLQRVHPDDRSFVVNSVTRALERKQPYRIDHRVVRPDGSERIVHEEAEVFRDETGRPVRMLGIVQDVTEHREAENRDRIVGALLTLFVKKSSRKEYLRAAIRLLRRASYCRCVGVRVADPDGFIPYESSIGFSETFLEQENRLCLHGDVCACIRVMAGKPEPQDMPLMTPTGSFCCHDSAAFVGSLTEAERARFRGTCVKHGFLSIGIVPIRHRDRILGAIHLADLRPNRLSPNVTAFMEVVAPLIGEALFRFQVEEDLRQAGVYNRSLIEASLDPLMTIDADGRIADVNEATEKATGRPRATLIGMDFADCFTNPRQAREVYRQVFRDGQVRDYPLEIRRRDDYATPVLYNASLYRDEQGKILGIFAAARDITERRKAERALEAYQAELRALAFRLSMAEERVRRDLAVALHDTVGQTLALSKMKLGALGQRVTAPDAKMELTEIREMFEEAVRQTRTLSFELSPPILYELGLDAALEWLGEEFQKRHGFRFRFECTDKKEIPESVSVLMFQAVRELLVNTGKHAKASEVRVVSRMEGPQLSILVNDNGIGFDLEAAAAAAGDRASLGLFSIRERMRHIGGSFTMETRPGQGATAVLRAPLECAPSPERDGVRTSKKENGP